MEFRALLADNMSMKFRLHPRPLLSWIHSGVPLGRVYGIPVTLHAAMVLVIAYWMLLGVFSASPLSETFHQAIFVSILLGSILLHELGHCYGAWLVGGGSQSITLWPLGGIANLWGSERSPVDEIIVVLFGPLVSLVLALGAWALSRLIPVGLAANPSVGITLRFLTEVAIINASLFAFNMAVPLFPMDCARLLRAILSLKFNAQRVTYNLCLFGLFVAGAMTCLYLIGLVDPSPSREQYGIFFMLVAMFGVQSCLIQMRVIESSEVYAEPWREAPSVRSLASRVLWSVTRGRVEIAPPPRVASPRRRHEAPAAVIEISERESLLTDLERAVQDEDFLKAAEIRDRLRGLTGKSQKT